MFWKRIYRRRRVYLSECVVVAKHHRLFILLVDYFTRRLAISKHTREKERERENESIHLSLSVGSGRRRHYVNHSGRLCHHPTGLGLDDWRLVRVGWRVEQSRLNAGPNWLAGRNSLCVQHQFLYRQKANCSLGCGLDDGGLDAERMSRVVDIELELIDIGPRSAAGCYPSRFPVSWYGRIFSGWW